MQGTVAYDISPIKGPLANAFVILINALFFNVKLVGLYDVYPRDYSEHLLNEDDLIFDFIIVGAGAAGSAVANRLTEHELFSVLLVEAGDYPPPSTAVPGLYHTFYYTEQDWQFKLENDPKACQAVADHRCTVNRGKVLGGTSAINNLRYVRDMSYNFDKMGIPHVSSNITFGIYSHIEGFEKDEQEHLSYTYGIEGPIALDLYRLNDSIRNLLKDSYRATGYAGIPRRKYIGFTDHLLFIKDGERCNMAKAFLSPIKERPNLFFSKNTEVEGLVVMEPKDKRVNGVNVSISGVKFFIRARKEVILAAGPINNAKLLLVSGIGPQRYLESKNIHVIADSPGVGKNLQFHLILPLYVSIDTKPKDYFRELDLIRDIFDYLMFRSGNLSHTGINNMVHYISTFKAGATIPNIAILHKYFRIGDRNLNAWLDGINYHPKITKTLLEVSKEKSILLFLVSLIQPESRGELFLNDTHHLGNPTIYPKFMTDDEEKDFDSLLGAFNYVTNLTRVAEMQELNAEFLDVNIPNCMNFKFCTMAYVKCYIFNMLYTAPDAAGTAKIGEDCDDDSVVRKDLEVRQVRCLRVADSSILQGITAGNTIATDAMLGFNLGEILKEKWMKNYTSPFYKSLVEQEPQEEQPTVS